MGRFLHAFLRSLDDEPLWVQTCILVVVLCLYGLVATGLLLALNAIVPGGLFGY